VAVRLLSPEVALCETRHARAASWMKERAGGQTHGLARNAWPD